VGMAPGQNELLAGVPFVGPSGRLLGAGLANASMSLDQCRIINVINCFPLGKNEKISQEQALACASRFEADVEASGAEVVLALGGDALLRLTGHKGQITRWRGHILRPEDMTPVRPAKGAIQPVLPPGCRWVVPSLHPSFVIRNGLKPLPFLFEDIKRLRRALDDELRIVQINGSLDLTRLDDLEPLVLDIETGEGGIERLGLATEHGSGTYEFEPRLGEYLSSPSLKLGHNLSFDVLHLRKEGVEVKGPLFDTMWAGQMLQPDLDKNLDTMSSLYLDIPRWKHLSRERPEYYNEMDVVATRELWRAQVPLLEETGQLDLFKREMDCLPILINMTHTGVRVDAVARDELRTQIEAKLASSTSRWQSLCPGVNPASPAQLRKLLYFDLGLPAAHKKGKTDPTTEKAVLQKLVRKAKGQALDVLSTLLEIRETSKLLSVYFQGGDRVYPSYFPVGKDDDKYGTATGRLSAQNPNIQQVPKHLRSMFVPEVDYVMVVGDWSQLELRIAAALAHDEALLALFKAGRDPFDEIARDFTKVDRTRIKNLVYGGGCYGAGWKKLGDTLQAQGYDTPAKTIKEFLEWFRHAFPGISQRNQNVVKEARRQGYIENAFGRRRYFYDADQHVPEIINFPIQSAAADMLWVIMGRIDQVSGRFGGRSPIAFIHDEIVIQARQSDSIQASQELKWIMESEFSEIGEGFRVPAKISIGPSWGELI